MKDILSIAERETLKKLERVIEKGVSTFLEVGAALLRIRDEKLYRAEYKTFDGYCLKRWGFRSSRARQLIASTEVIAHLKSVTSGNTSTAAKEGTLPSSERQARPLVGFNPEEQKEIWEEATRTAPKGGVTGEHVEKIAKKRFKKAGKRSPHIKQKERIKEIFKYDEGMKDQIEKFVSKLVNKYAERIVSVELTATVKGNEF
jgi:hypothetical protein